MPELVRGLNRVCQAYLSYIVAAGVSGFLYFGMWGAGIERQVVATEERSTSAAAQLAEVRANLHEIKDTVTTIAVDAAVTRERVEQMERRAQ